MQATHRTLLGRMIFSCLTLVLMIIGSPFVQAQDPEKDEEKARVSWLPEDQDTIDCSPHANYHIAWVYSPEMNTGMHDPRYFVHRTGWVSDYRLGFDDEGEVNKASYDSMIQLDQESYCELVRYADDVMTSATPGATWTPSHYMIMIMRGETGDVRTARWNRTDRSDEITKYLDLFIRLNNLLPPEKTR